MKTDLFTYCYAKECVTILCKLPYRLSHVLTNVRPTVNTDFIDKLCCLSVLMLRPTVWNSLPSFVRTADSFVSCMSQLKTYMFARHL